LPIQFAKNLINAAASGSRTSKNFLKHLQDALFEWLTGSLEGVVLPETWDLKGILSVVFQMLGLTYANIRSHLVKLIPEPAVKALETTFSLVKTLITEGPMAAWEQLKQLASDVTDAFIGAVKDWIKMKVIEEAIKTVVGLFVPGAGIIRAIIAIYDTIVFFIQRAKDIIQMLGNFLGSIAEIAAGNVGAAADALENGLARALKLVIDFLARFLHLCGITKKIRDTIQKIRGKVDEVIEKVAKWVVEKAKGLLSKAVEKGKAVVRTVAGWMGFSENFQGEDGESHRLYVAGDAANPKIMVASAPEEIERKFEKAQFAMKADKSLSEEERKTYTNDSSQHTLSDVKKRMAAPMLRG
jgi:hypothetical protein